MSRGTDGPIVARAALVNVIGMLAKASRGLVTIFVTRVSGSAVFGLYILTVSVSELVARFTVFGMDKSLLKYVPETRTSGDGAEYRVLSAALYTGLILSLVATAILVAVAPWVVDVWLSDARLTQHVRIAALAVLPLTWLTLLLSATKALKIMRYDAIVAGLVVPLAMLVLAVPILWAADDVRVLVIAYLLSIVIGALLASWFFARHFSLRRAFSTRPSADGRELLKFSTPLGFHDLIQFLSMKLELFILAFFVTAPQLGIYALASELAFVMKKVRQSVDPIMIPLMSEAVSLGETDRMREQLVRVIRWIGLVCFPFLGVMWLFGEPILALFGEGFATGSLVLALLCLAQLLNTITGTFDLSMLVSGRPRINLMNISTLLVLQTTLNLWLIPRYGIVGGASAAALSFAFLALVRLAQMRFILKLNPLVIAHLKPGLAAGVAALLVMGGRQLLDMQFAGQEWIALALFLLAYTLVLRTLGMEAEDVALFRGGLDRLRRRANRRE